MHHIVREVPTDPLDEIWVIDLVKTSVWGTVGGIMRQCRTQNENRTTYCIAISVTLALSVVLEVETCKMTGEETNESRKLCWIFKLEIRV